MDDDLGLHRRLLPPSSSRADSVALETGGLDGRELTEGISANSPPITESIRVAAGISANSPPVTESITVAAGDSAVTASTAVRPSRGRLACLDVFRGLTIAVMVLVDDAGGEFPHINHAPWNGLHLADFVMPFFLFIVGIAMAFSLKKLADPGRAALRSLERSIKLFLLGVLLQGGYYHDVGKLDFGVDIARLRVCGILQRIALAFLVVSLCEIAHSTRTRHLKLARGQPPAAEEGGVRDSPSETQLQLQIFAQFPLHWACFGVILVLYCALLYGVRVPSWSFPDASGKMLQVHCGTLGTTGPSCNSAGYIDRLLLGLPHLYQHPVYQRTPDCSTASPGYGPLPADAPVWCRAPFDPEGLLSSLCAVLSCFWGIHFGHILLLSTDHKRVLMWSATSSAVLTAAGAALHFSGLVPFNKPLYTVSYMLFTGGVGGFVFMLLYFQVDMLELRWPTLPLQWLGTNPLLVFVLAACGVFEAALGGWYYRSPENNLVNLTQAKMSNLFESRSNGVLSYVLLKIICWCLVAAILHKIGIYWRF